jgi:hypothetical protein
VKLVFCVVGEGLKTGVFSVKGEEKEINGRGRKRGKNLVGEKLKNKCVQTGKWSNRKN